MGKELRIFQFQPTEFGVIPTVCPECSQGGTFDPLAGIKDINNIDIGNNRVRWVIGLRKCPKPSCNQLILFVFDHLAGVKKLITQWPRSRIEFIAKSVPEDIVSTLNEAIECHANKCYRASAAMVRRTLEEICDDKGHSDGVLKDRIDNLKDSVTIAPALFDGMHDIRFLGNDGTHVELKWFDEVGEEELSVAIELTKKIIEGIYQSQDLVNRLKALKKPPPTT